VLGYLGIIEWEQGTLEDAARDLGAAVELGESAGAQRERKLFLSYLGALHAISGKMADALGTFERARSVPLEIEKLDLLEGFIDLALRNADQGEPASAEAHLRAAEERLAAARAGAISRLPIEVRPAARLLDRAIVQVTAPPTVPWELAKAPPKLKKKSASARKTRAK
jgi:hypothetical protein